MRGTDVKPQVVSTACDFMNENKDMSERRGRKVSNLIVSHCTASFLTGN